MSPLKKVFFWIVLSVQTLFLISLIAVFALTPREVEDAWRNWMRVTPLTQQEQEAEAASAWGRKVKKVVIAIGVFGIADFLIFYTRPKRAAARAKPAEEQG